MTKHPKMIVPVIIVTFCVHSIGFAAGWYAHTRAPPPVDALRPSVVDEGDGRYCVNWTRASPSDKCGDDTDKGLARCCDAFIGCPMRLCGDGVWRTTCELEPCPTGKRLAECVGKMLDAATDAGMFDANGNLRDMAEDAGGALAGEVYYLHGADGGTL